MITVTVKPDNAEPYEVVADSRDVYVWEKTSRNGITIDRLLESLSMVELYRLAHIAARRQQLYLGDLDSFVETCAIDFVEEDQQEQPDPTEPGASPGD